MTPDDLRHRVEHQSKLSSIPPKEKLQTANSNLFYIEEGGDTHSMITPMVDYGHHHGIHNNGGYNMATEKKHSKFFSEEISFVIAVVTLAVFLCFLSSVFIPLAFLFFFNGGLLPFSGGLNGLFPISNTITAGGGIGSMMGKRRRKRSSTINDRDTNIFDQYFDHFYSAMKKFE
ncbi:uncharacterized protein LOC113793169 [Dermatophagoides pteronyssinus]|uniref:Uncharacterized protein LOC113793169 n=1 Tax=Dermatophagoides pteronyssinus TaxID=6956 RepID=A0A6P6Y113_DERPT|nr:uncharacterized protein LOC113793169 [Dermatophagoides pteronyssinus]